MRLPAGHFYGSLRRRRDVSGFVLVEKLHSPDETLLPHSHECAYLSFVLTGRYTERCGSSVRDCYPGSLAFHPEGEIHSDRFHAAGGRLFALQLTPSSSDRLRRAGVAVDRGRTVTGGPALRLAIRLYDEFRACDAASAISIEGLTLELLAELSRDPGSPPAAPSRGWLEEADDFIERHFTESVSLAMVAGHVGVHPVHLAREFRKRHRCTIGDYIRRLRVDRARRQLTRTDERITTIALDSGFADHSHLSRTFKSSTGLSPTDFRRRFRPH
jgi:AraC family transcriptional regulator